ALLCSHEVAVPGSLQKCIRVLIHWNTTKQPHEIEHVYLRSAAARRRYTCSISCGCLVVFQWISTRMHFCNEPGTATSCEHNSADRKSVEEGTSANASAR